MDGQFCQSCGLPMDGQEELYGTNADGSMNNEYCEFCYENGEFTEELTMEEMLEVNVPFLVEHHPELNEFYARRILLEILPTLKRWANTTPQ